MSDCNHNHLTRLEGPLHPGGKDYLCNECGEQFGAEPIVIDVQFGKPPAGQPEKEGE
jgi:hypothetical protein